METTLAVKHARIIELAANCVSRLQRTAKRNQTPDLTTTLLLSHLSTLESTLSQLQTWLTASDLLRAQHHHLMTVVDAVLASCYLVLSVLNDQIAEIDNADGRISDRFTKARLDANHKVTITCVGHISHLTIALDVLLMAFRCENQIEQLDLLQNQQTRYILYQVRDDSSELAEIRDEMTMKTILLTGEETMIETPGLPSPESISPTFQFENELLQSKVYRDGLRAYTRDKPRPSDYSTSRYTCSIPLPPPKRLTILYTSIPNRPATSLIKRLQLVSPRGSEEDRIGTKPDSITKSETINLSATETTETTTNAYAIRHTTINRDLSTLEIRESIDTGDPCKIPLDHYMSLTQPQVPNLTLIELNLTSRNKIFVASAIAAVKVILGSSKASSTRPTTPTPVQEAPGPIRPNGILVSIMRSAGYDGVEYEYFIEQKIRKSNKNGVPMSFVWNCGDLGSEIERFAEVLREVGTVAGVHTTTNRKR
ncbi:Target of rapamycin complex subunit [Venturia nashicola]|uniref:Target of rapamycin complex subunit n=1 Tax=Venturia nashicola TaxID=86259 RepID=A0A4Z1NWL4_9PEZI|nr:Target of rapamycin complex subunit [Venturia nashicola]TLD22451.1 Target of rapamycin complex subunit [Venturia nashicola]